MASARNSSKPTFRQKSLLLRRRVNEGRLDGFYRMDSKHRVDGKDFYEISKAAQAVVRAEFMRTLSEIPLRPQPVGAVLNFVYESHLH